MLRCLASMVLLLAACIESPEKIPAPDGGTPNPLDASIPVQDAGDSIGWSLSLAEGALFGPNDSTAGAEDPFQLTLRINGPDDAAFTLWVNDSEVITQSTDDTGVTDVNLVLEHGNHRVELRAQGPQLSRTCQVDLTAPTIEGFTAIEPERQPNLQWTDINDADDVGSDAISELTIRIDNGEPANLNAATGNHRLTGLTLGTHSLVLTATDEKGNSTQIERDVVVGFQTTAYAVNRALMGRPCAGDFNGDNLQDIAFSPSPSSFEGRITTRVLLGTANAEDDVRINAGSAYGKTSCLFTELRNDGGAELVLASQGYETRGKWSKVEFLFWRPGNTSSRFHTLAASEQLVPHTHINIAWWPQAVYANTPDQTSDALVISNQYNQLMLVAANRFTASAASSMTDFNQTATLALPGIIYLEGELVAHQPGAGGRAGIAFNLGFPQPGRNWGIWVLNTPFRLNQGFAVQVDDETYPSSFPHLDHLRTWRPQAEGPETLLATDHTRSQLLHHTNAGDVGTRLTGLPNDIGTIQDLAACDLLGNGNDVLSVAGNNRHYIRWADGQWEATDLTGDPVHTLCPGDMTGDGLADLLVVTNRSANRLTLFH